MTVAFSFPSGRCDSGIEKVILKRKKRITVRKLCINRKTTKHMDMEDEHTASINCLISDSEILVPSFGKPDLSSSRVIVPLLSVSRDLNISFRPIISSSDKFSATTWLKLMKMLELSAP
jgi:hypothetical protein